MSAKQPVADDKATAKRIGRYSQTFGSTIFAGYNQASPAITSKRIHGEIARCYQEHDQSVAEKSALEEAETPKATLNKSQLQEVFESPIK